MTMTLEVSEIIEAPATHVWSVLIDTTLWPSWGPSVIDVDHDGRFLAPGSSGRVRTSLGFWLPFDVTAFDDGRSWTWKVGGFSASDHGVEPLGPQRCELAFGVPRLAAPYLIVCKIAMRRIADLAAPLATEAST